MKIVNLQDTNIDLDEFIKNNLEGVNEAILNNPQFRPQLFQAIKYLTRKEGTEIIPTSEVIIGKDGMSFEIRSGIRKQPDCKAPELHNNRSFSQVKFAVVDDEDLGVTQSTGTFYKTEDYIRNDPESMIAKKASGQESLFCSVSPNIISAYHSYSRYTKDGIEIQHATFKDDYPVSSQFDSKDDLIIQTLNYHAPSIWRFNSHPGEAEFEYNPETTNTFRFLNRLGIATIYRKEGKGENTKREAFEAAVSTEYPENLICPVTIIDYSKQKEEQIEEPYRRLFPDMTQEQIFFEISKAFLTSLDNSRTKEYRPELLERIREIAIKGLSDKYGYQVDQTPEEEKAR